MSILVLVNSTGHCVDKLTKFSVACVTLAHTMQHLPTILQLEAYMKRTLFGFQELSDPTRVANSAIKMHDGIDVFVKSTEMVPITPVSVDMLSSQSSLCFSIGTE